MKLLAAKKVTTSVRKMQMMLKRMETRKIEPAGEPALLAQIISALDC